MLLGGSELGSLRNDALEIIFYFITQINHMFLPSSKQMIVPNSTVHYMRFRAYQSWVFVSVAWKVRSHPGWGRGGRPWTAVAVRLNSLSVCCSWRKPSPGKDPSSKWCEHTHTFTPLQGLCQSYILHIGLDDMVKIYIPIYFLISVEII